KFSQSKSDDGGFNLQFEFHWHCEGIFRKYYFFHKVDFLANFYCSCGFHESRLVYEGAVLVCEWEDCMVRFKYLNGDAMFDEILKYVNHINLHIELLDEKDRDNRCYKCHWKGCTMKFKNKNNLKIHVQHHSGDKAAACPFCGCFFANNSKLFYHMLRRNLSKGNSTIEKRCILCHKVFDSARLLREHCRRHIVNLKCEYCAVMVGSPSALRRHILTVHLKRKIYRCNQCKGRFILFLFELNILHSVLHSNNLEFECAQCGSKFRWQKQLTNHVRKHQQDYTPYTHLCHLCSAKYTNGFGLTRHLKIKHNFTIPTGFTRFQYKKCADGFFRLQTRRCLSQALAKDNAHFNEAHYVS
ncbi:unnamed protein product, partial [Dracunculus medinensis]|uniref:Histone H4 transcription factor n=1 Tax=Dracunculus medinensis TaxID=318479 RepID=A0A0N4UDF7_DRAME